MNRSLHVAFDARSLAAPVLRGMDRYTVGLAREFVRQGVRVTLLHREREPICERHVESLGCDVMALKDRCGLHWEQVALPRALYRNGFDIYHAPAERGVPWVAPCPVVLTIHSVTSHSYRDLVARGMLRGPVARYLGYDARPGDRRFAVWYQGTGFRRADHVLTPSAFARDEVIRFLGIDPERVTATPLALPEQFRAEPHPADVRAEVLQKFGIRGPYLLYVGGYEPHKNVEGLLAAFALVRATRPDLQLVLVGSKTLPPSIRDAARRLHLAESRDVVFLVNVTSELNDLYDGAELFVSLSWRETFCLPALEALSRGVAVVASQWGATQEVVGDAGQLVDPRDHRAAAEAIVHLLNAPNRAELVERARQRAATFAWSRSAEQTRQVYERLSKGGLRIRTRRRRDLALPVIHFGVAES